MLPDEPTQQRDTEEANDSCAVAPQRLAGEMRNELHDDAEGRQDEDVYLGGTEEPEEIRPEIVPAAVRGEEERRLHGSIQRQLYESRRQHRRRQHAEDRGREDAPD